MKATAPAALSRPISVISSPCRPLVSAAIGWMLTIAVSRARRSTKSTVAESSITGEVSGWQTMVVMPPAAAALACGRKGLAMAGAGLADEGAHVDQAGRDDLAGAVDDLGAFGHAGRADAAPRVADDAVGDQHVAGAVEIARGIDRCGRWRAGWGGGRFSMMSRVGQVAGERFEHRHAHRDAHLDLLADQRLRAVGDDRVDLDAAVHRPGMHDQRVGLGVGELLLVEAEIVEIFRASRARTSRSCARAAAAAS